MASLKNFIDAEYPGMERGNMINLQERGQRIALAVLGAADKHLTELRDASLSSFVTKPVSAEHSPLPGAVRESDVV